MKHVHSQARLTAPLRHLLYILSSFLPRAGIGLAFVRTERQRCGSDYHTCGSDWHKCEAKREPGKRRDFSDWD